MERWKRIRVGSGALSLCLLAVLLFYPMDGFGRVLLITPALAGFVCYTAAERRIGRCKADAHIVRLTSHHRHDWMNDLQVMLGLLRFNKTDKLQDYMDKIKARVLNESNMARLGIPAVIVYLFDLRAENRAYMLEVEIEEEVDLRELAIGPDRVYKLIRAVTERFAACAVPSQGEPNVLSLSFEREGERLLLDFVFSGKSDASLKERLRESLVPFKGRFELAEEQFSEGKAVLTLLLPFRK